MFADNATIVSTLLVLAASAGTWTMFNYFSPEASQQRRRRKNHGRVVVKARRPVVSLFCRASKT